MSEGFGRFGNDGPGGLYLIFAGEEQFGGGRTAG